MCPGTNERFLMTNPAVYRIRVTGRLDSKWSAYFNGMNISTVDDEIHGTCTDLVGLLADQAALLGVIQSIYGLVISIVRVECLDTFINCKGKDLHH